MRLFGKTTRCAALAGAALLVASAQSAHAATWLITAQGTMINGRDFSGAFGPAGAVLAGTAISVSETIETHLRQTLEDTSSRWVFRTAASAASVTINGITRNLGVDPNNALESFDGIFDNNVSGDYAASGDLFHTEVNAGGGRLQIIMQSLDLTTLPVRDLINGFAYTYRPGDRATGNFRYNVGAQPVPGYPLVLGNANGDFQLSGFQLQQIAPDPPPPPPPPPNPGGVPEPASWALMLFGFGAAGASLRGAHRSRNGLPKVLA